jgi:glucose/arabinose dehydrogenase
MTGGYRFPLLFLFLILILTLAVACGDDESTSSPTPSGPTYAFGLSSEVVAGEGNADNVSAIAFAPDGRIFYAQQFGGDTGNTGAIRVIQADGTVQSAPFATVTVANHLNLDWGLTGLALDPDFATNHFVYAFYTADQGDGSGKPTLVRFTDANGTATDQTTISDDFPVTFAKHEGYNANGDIHFGPDGYLYVSIGDYDQGTAKPEEGGHPELVADLSTPIGKMLRISKEDGSAAPDNPFVGQEGADPRVFAYGFREPFPFTFDAAGSVYGTDNTPVSCEELNVIGSGAFYGWPEGWAFPFDNCAIGQGTQPVYNFARGDQQPNAFLSFAESQGISFLAGSKYKQLGDSLLVCQSEKSLVQDVTSPGAIRQIVLDSSGAVTSTAIVVNDCKGEVIAHNGAVYYATQTEIRKLIDAPAGGSPTITGQQPPPLSS